MSDFQEWNEFEKELNITSEEEYAIQLEMQLIKTVIEARKQKNITQQELSKDTGIKQPAIARIEKGINSPSINTLIKLLVPLGYTLSIVPLSQKNKNKK